MSKLSEDFRTLASFRDPSKVTPAIYFKHTQRTLTIFYPFRKSEFHFVMLPRLGDAPRVAENLEDLYTWLNSPDVTKKQAKRLLLEMEEDVQEVLADIDKEMMTTYGRRWGVQVGFSSDPTIKFMHLHIMSDDLRFLKETKHWNQFDPNYDYFIQLENVISWFESYAYKNWIKNCKNRNLLTRKPPFECHHYRCDFFARTFAELDRHLKSEWEKAEEEQKRSRERALQESKSK